MTGRKTVQRIRGRLGLDANAGGLRTRLNGIGKGPVMSTQNPSSEYPGFHAHSGFYFRRLDAGRVQVRTPDSVVEFDAGTWVSAVASVSAAGETSESFRAAELLHDGPVHKHDWRHYPGGVMQCLRCPATKPIVDGTGS